MPWHSPMFPPRAVLFGWLNIPVLWLDAEPNPPPVEAPKAGALLPAAIEAPKGDLNNPPPDALLVLLLVLLLPPKPPKPPDVPAVAVPLPKRPEPAVLVVAPKPLARFWPNDEVPDPEPKPPVAPVNICVSLYP